MTINDIVLYHKSFQEKIISEIKLLIS